MASSTMRSANITIPLVNFHESTNTYTTYTLEDIVQTVKRLESESGIDYSLILHDEQPTPHVHIVIKFKTPYRFLSLKQNFFPYGKIETCKSYVKSVQYLVHLNDETKVQYSWDDVITNISNLNKFKVKSSSTTAVKFNEIRELIELGKIRRYERFSKIPSDIYVEFKTKINYAFEHYEGGLIMNNRNITVMFIQGETGTGKTTLAKFISEGLCKPYVISSSSNDPMQDYEGQEVLILDELRDDIFKFHDFLKIIDNHTTSSVKSRYNNKQFLGDTIIITSSKPLQNWYMGVNDEDRKQFFRRLNVVYEITPDGLNIKAAPDVNFETGQPNFEIIYPNPTFVTREVRKSQAMKIMQVLGIEPIMDTGDIKTKADFEASQVQMDEWKKSKQ